MIKKFFIPLFTIVALLLCILFSQFVLYILFGCLWILSFILLITERNKEKTIEMLPRIILFLVLFNITLSVALTSLIVTSEDMLIYDSEFLKNICLILTYAILILVLYFGSLHCNNTKKLCIKRVEFTLKQSNTERDYFYRLSKSMKILFGHSKSLFFLCVVSIIGNVAFGLMKNNLEIIYVSSLKTLILIILSIVPNVLMSMTVKQSLKK